MRCVAVFFPRSTMYPKRSCSIASITCQAQCTLRAWVEKDNSCRAAGGEDRFFLPKFVALIKLSVFESFETTKHRNGSCAMLCHVLFFLGWIHKNAFPDRISWGSYEASTSWRQRQVMCDVAQLKLQGNVWGNLPKVMITFRPFKAWWSGSLIVKGSSWSWTQTWWVWWPWWAIVFFWRLFLIWLFNKLPMGLMRSELQFSWIFKKVTEWHRPMRESLQTWNVSMWFRLPNVILSVSNGAFVATVAAEQFRYRCLQLGGSSHSQVDIRGLKTWRLIRCNLGA